MKKKERYMFKKFRAGFNHAWLTIMSMIYVQATKNSYKITDNVMKKLGWRNMYGDT